MSDTDSVAQYFKSIHDVVAEVSREEMHELWKRAKRGDRRAKRRIMELNLRLVVPTAKKYHRPGTDLMDLIEEGNLGLMHAIDKFEPAKGYRFSTYATYWIEQYIRRSVEEQSGAIRIPPHAWESLRKWLKQWDSMHTQLGRNPTLSEMAEKMNWSARQVKAIMEVQEAAKGVGSLTAPIDNDDELTMEDTITDHADHSPDSLISTLKLSDELMQAMKSIGEREREIIDMRYGLGGGTPMTLDTIGKKMKLSRERVRQLEERGILRLKNVAQRMGLIEAREMPQAIRPAAPNFHPGKMGYKGPTNVLGQPTKNNLLYEFYRKHSQPETANGKNQRRRKH
ncbi:MAG: sigma-70 family RNA polymerase sigma factor [Elusimicrobia bacterium]|nr:sigma-70 family RNA polymerase sigma factor [Elusimicrobiota bacterium]